MFQLLPQTTIEISTQLTHAVSGQQHHYALPLIVYVIVQHAMLCSLFSHPHRHIITVTQDESSPAGQISHTRSVACLAKGEKYQVPHLQDMCISI